MSTSYVTLSPEDWATLSLDDLAALTVSPSYTFTTNAQAIYRPGSQAADVYSEVEIMEVAQ